MVELLTSNLKAWRKKAGISQKKLARLTGLSLVTLRQAERGRTKPQARTIGKLNDIISKVQGSAKSAAAPVKKAVKPPKARKIRKVRKVARKTAASKRFGRPRKAAAAAPKTAGAHPIELTDIDIALINRVLRLKTSEKLSLLQKII